jgi:hypothetical protein
VELLQLRCVSLRQLLSRCHGAETGTETGTETEMKMARLSRETGWKDDYATGSARIVLEEESKVNGRDLESGLGCLWRLRLG